MADERERAHRTRVQRKNKLLLAVAIAAVVALLVFLAIVLIKPPVAADIPAPQDKNTPAETVTPDDQSAQESDDADREPEPEPEEPPVVLTKGYLAADGQDVEIFTSAGSPAGSLPRGTEIEYNADEPGPEGFIAFALGELERCVRADAVVDDVSKVVREQTLYVRTAVNMSDENGVSLGRFLEKGSAVKVTGYSGLQDDGTVVRYLTEQEGETGYVAPKYLVADSAEAEAMYDGFGMYSKHASREDMYGGGEAGNLDYYPRPKEKIEGNVMPDEVKALYLSNSWVILDEVDCRDGAVFADDRQVCEQSNRGLRPGDKKAQGRRILRHRTPDDFQRSLFRQGSSRMRHKGARRRADGDKRDVLADGL